MILEQNKAKICVACALALFLKHQIDVRRTAYVKVGDRVLIKVSYMLYYSHTESYVNTDGWDHLQNCRPVIL